MKEKIDKYEFSWLERQFSDSVIFGVLDITPVIDKFSSWSMAGVTATGIAILANIDKLDKFLEINDIRIIFALCGVSILFGFGQKYCALKISMSIHINDSIEKRITTLVKKITDQENPDIWRYIRENTEIAKTLICIATGFPAILRKALLKRFLEDRPLDMSKHKEHVSTFIRQIIYMGLQIITAIIIIPIVILNI